MAEQSPRAGWYPDTKVAGGQRYWDGERWTNQRRPTPLPAPVRVAPAKRRGWSTRTYGIASVIAYVLSGSVYSWTDLTVEDRVRYGVLLTALATGFALVAIIATGVRLGLGDRDEENG
jgi:hypothetical protein